MKIYICDDDERSRKEYARALQIIFRRQKISAVIHTFDSAEKMLVKTPDLTYVDMVFMDIHMPKMNGFEALKAMRKDGFKGVVIFLCSTSQYWQQAFDLEAFNYIVKKEHVDMNRLERIVINAVDQCNHIREEMMWVNNGYESKVIPLSQIHYMEVRKRVITVHYGRDKEFAFYSQLSKIEDDLDPKGFVRVHRAFIVSIDRVTGIDKLTLHLKGGLEVPIGEKFKPHLVDRLKENCNVVIC